MDLFKQGELVRPTLCSGISSILILVTRYIDKMAVRGLNQALQGG